MCVTSRNHSCSQYFLLFVLVLSLFLFCLSIFAHFGLYFTTAPSDSDSKSGDLLALAAGETAHDDDVEIVKKESFFSKLKADWILTSNCSWIQTQIDAGKLFGFCNDSNTDASKLECFRSTILYVGFGSTVLAGLVILSIIAVCRLALCAVLLLGAVYLLLGIAETLVLCLYHDSVILNALTVSGTLTPLAYQIIAMAALFYVLAFLHLLVFIAVGCERRRAAGSKSGLKHSTSDDENGLDIDDPRAPLYGYSSRPGNDFDERVKDFKYIDDDMSYILRK